MAGQLIWRAGPGLLDAFGNVLLVKQYSGPNLKLADRVADVDVYRGPINLCRSAALLRGTFGSDIGVGSLATQGRRGWVVTSSDVKWEQKNIGTLTINWEVGGPFAPAYLLPLDDWREETVELYPKVERNKSLMGADVATNPNHRISIYVIGLAYAAQHQIYTAWNASAMSTNAALNTLYNLTAQPGSPAPPAGSSWAEQKAWGLKLFEYLMDGHETYYLAGVKYCYMRHYFSFPATTMGGIIQSPSWGPRAGDATLSWLRLADSVEPVGVNGSAFKVTSTWLGGPGGHWNTDLYAA